MVGGLGGGSGRVVRDEVREGILGWWVKIYSKYCRGFGVSKGFLLLVGSADWRIRRRFLLQTCFCNIGSKGTDCACEVWHE